MHTIVIGAGIVGVSCALEIRRRGLDVTLVDRLEPGDACSFGNAGVIASGSLTPVAMPGIAFEVPRMLLRPGGPLALRWRHLPTLAPWLLAFLRASASARANRYADALRLLVHDSVERHDALAAGSEAQRLIRKVGSLYAYPDAAARRADARWAMRAARGVRFHDVAGEVLRSMEPDLSPALRHAVQLPDTAYVSDPARYVKLLAQQLVREGAEVMQADVRGIETPPNRPVRVATDVGPLHCDRLVVAAGVWSGRLASQLGLRVPLEAERGYHVMVHDPGVEVNHPVFHVAGAFVATPMDRGLRFAGTDELAAIDAPPNYGRARAILDRARAMFPGLNTRDVTEWMGQRPSLPDSLPVVGRVPGHPRVLLAFGHHHVGLTGGPVTGRWIADIVTDTQHNVDLSAFAPERFVGRGTTRRGP
jgi:D-amino-acid dehydrogenase